MSRSGNGTNGQVAPAAERVPAWPPPASEPVRTSSEALARAREIVDVRCADERALTERRLEALEAAIDERLAALEARTFQHAAEAIGAISLRIDAIESRCAAGDERLDQLEALASRLDSVIGAVSQADAARYEQLVEFRRQLSDGLRQIDHIEPIRARCASLSQTTAQLQDELTTQRTALADGLATMDLQLREVEQAMAGDAMAEISAHLDRMEELERAIAELDPDRFVTREELQASG